ncbi:MAG: hypothetical protein N3H31_04380 [Candidatus Nezhaarchaeota archaeon]|nr:hypothetical protein [Candidatus Nezhaarchaeota archaeon]
MTAYLEAARRLMEEYAHSTGVVSEGEKRRYLWSDSFAVFNFIELHRLTGEDRYRKLALQLVDQVHHVLGRHRGDDGRSGWISGLEEREAEEHPTIGGLRIGKRLPERRADEPYDPLLEWERDGQYYHYLTKWMLALCRVAQATGDNKYLGWAVELAEVAHKAFTYTSALNGRRRIYWKMSIDLTRPLVLQEGAHDAIDGLVTYAELQTASPTESLLREEVAELMDMCRSRDWSEWVTEDPLGVGELLSLSYRAARLTARGAGYLKEALQPLLEAAYVSLRAYLPREVFSLPASRRLAFRELGLSIGLHAAERLGRLAGEVGLEHRLILSLEKFTPMRAEIEKFWLNQANQESRAWSEHRDINIVMLAASLLPEGYLGR